MKSRNRIFATLLLVSLVACTTPSKLTEGAPRLTSTPVLVTDTPEQTEPTATDGNVTAIQDMLTDRAAHTATLLPNGKVLIAGGFNGSENSLSSAEIFDPASSKFLPTDSMSFARQSHTATLLQNGKVLIAGGYGYNGEYLSSAELYDPLTGKFIPTEQMAIPRAGHIAALLNNGKVLLAGGVGAGWTFLDSAELYDPNTNTFTLTGNMTIARESHTATLLKDGKVLITGGHKGRRSSIIIYSSAELYDPTSGLFTSTTSMLTERHKHDAVLLEDGRVLVVGGADERDDGGQYSSAEIYDPHTGMFTMAGNMNASRYKFQGTSVLLRTGKVLLIGGAGVTEIYDPVTNTFSKVIDGLGTTRLFATATSLPDGKVILVGGYGTNISASANAWVFQP